MLARVCGACFLDDPEALLVQVVHRARRFSPPTWLDQHGTAPLDLPTSESYYLLPPCLRSVCENVEGQRHVGGGRGSEHENVIPLQIFARDHERGPGCSSYYSLNSKFLHLLATCIKSWIFPSFFSAYVSCFPSPSRCSWS